MPKSSRKTVHPPSLMAMLTSLSVPGRLCFGEPAVAQQRAKGVSGVYTRVIDLQALTGCF